MRSNSDAGPLGPVTSQRRTVSALSAGNPQSFAMSATESGRPIASPRCSRSRFSSGPVIAILSAVSESREQDRSCVRREDGARFKLTQVSRHHRCRSSPTIGGLGSLGAIGRSTNSARKRFLGLRRCDGCALLIARPSSGRCKAGGMEMTIKLFLSILGALGVLHGLAFVVVPGTVDTLYGLA